ncbi:MAG TPA: hypothetical protein VH112_09460 [Acidimicrobiales bacterium]|jgi:hypothetical protein|nr:hypothetical protein [Acidimicrobiales bacterium]
MALEDVVDELYGVDAAEFVAIRDKRAREARDAGDRALADQVKGLKRPSAAAWVVNVLVRHRPGEIERLLSFGQSFRDAQANLAGDELRRLGRQRHQVLGALGQEARRIAQERGQSVSQAVQRDVESTLDAALTDPSAADAVRSGRLLRSISHAGMGPVDLSGSLAAPEIAVRSSTGIPGLAPDDSKQGRPPEDEKIAAAREALEDADADVERADHGLSRAERTAEEAQGRKADAEQRVRALEEEVARADDRLRTATAEAAQAETDRRAARKALEGARRQANRARARLGRLDQTGLHVVRDTDT